MNMKIGIAVGVALIAIIGGGVLIASKKKEAAPAGFPLQPKTETTSATQSLSDLLSGSAQECKFTTDSATGTVHVSNQKMRADIVATSSVTTTTHMITDGKTSYFWVEGTGTGYKMQFDASAQTQKPVNDPKEPASQGVDVNQKYNYTCTTWSPDNTLFELPSNITFTDMSALTVPVTKVKATGSTSTTSKEEQCSACDSAPESYRVQCKQMLGCN